MQITEIWNQSALIDVVDSTNITQPVSGEACRLVPAATMIGYYDLSYFEPGVIAEAREMWHKISEVAIEYWFSGTCAVNIMYPVKHEISYSSAAEKDIEGTGPSTMDENT